MRGTRTRSGTVRAEKRFIPAYAGNTRRFATAESEVPVHPRVCGEHGGSEVVPPSEFGSSPRMRGTHKDEVREAAEYRFIPAYAGNTRARYPEFEEASVHPRVCGEHDGISIFLDPAAGSSPRMRGTQIGINEVRGCSRFIPAYAGNTCG